MSAWTVEMVARLMVRNRDRALCPDGVVRLDIDAEAKECVEECVRRVNDGGLMCADWYPLPGDKKLRLAVYPTTLELPKPQWSAQYGTREEARVAIRQERIQHPARYVMGKETEGGGFAVESWEPWDYLRQEMYPCYLVEEVINAHLDMGETGADIELDRQKAKKSGLDHLKAGAAKRKADQIAAFQRWRERYPKYSKEWIQGRIVKEHAKAHPRMRGWGQKTVEKNTADCI